MESIVDLVFLREELVDDSRSGCFASSWSRSGPHLQLALATGLRRAGVGTEQMQRDSSQRFGATSQETSSAPNSVWPIWAAASFCIEGVTWLYRFENSVASA